MKICGCLALFFYFGTQLWNCAKFSYAHDIKREGEGMYRYVRKIDGLRPCRLSCAPIHVWQGISYAWNHFMCNLVQIYNVISFTFTVFFSSSCCCFLLFYLFAHFFFPCMPRVSETNSQHNFICIHTSHTYDSECLPAAEAAAKTFPQGGHSKIFAQANAMVANFPRAVVAAAVVVAVCCLWNYAH